MSNRKRNRKRNRRALRQERNHSPFNASPLPKAEASSLHLSEFDLESFIHYLAQSGDPIREQWAMDLMDATSVTFRNPS